MIMTINWKAPLTLWTKNYTISIFFLVIAAIFFNYKIWFSNIRIVYVATFSQLGLLCSKFVMVTNSKILLINQILTASDIATVGWCRLLLATEFAWNQLSFLLVLCCLKVLHYQNNVSTLMVCLGKNKFGSISPWIAPRLVTHMKLLHTCLAKISSFVLSQQKVFSADILKPEVTERIYPWFYCQ